MSRTNIHRPSHFECAVMSSLAYKDLRQQLRGDHNQERHDMLRERGWAVLDVVNDESSGYWGVVFAHHDRRQVVVAHRGSKNWASFRADLKSVVRNKLHGQILSALNMILHDRVRNCTREHYHLTFTGHSLGGFLAEISVYYTRRKDLPYYQASHSSAITFESPGSFEFIEAAQSNAPIQRLDINCLDIATYLSYPNLVNTFATHPGLIYHVQTDIGRSTFSSYLLKTHSIDNMVNAFDSATDFPREGLQWKLVGDWPLSDYSELGNLPSLEGIAKLPFKLILDGYKVIKNKLSIGNRSNTYISDLLGGDQYRRFIAAQDTLSDSGRYSFLSEELLDDEQLRLSFQSHYSILPMDPAKSMSIKSFGPVVEQFLINFFAKRDQSSNALEQWKESFEINDMLWDMLNCYQLHQDASAVVWVSFEGDSDYLIQELRDELCIASITKPNNQDGLHVYQIEHYLDKSQQKLNDLLLKTANELNALKIDGALSEANAERISVLERQLSYLRNRGERHNKVIVEENATVAIGVRANTVVMGNRNVSQSVIDKAFDALEQAFNEDNERKIVHYQGLVDKLLGIATATDDEPGSSDQANLSLPGLQAKPGSKVLFHYRGNSLTMGNSNLGTSESDELSSAASSSQGIFARVNTDRSIGSSPLASPALSQPAGSQSSVQSHHSDEDAADGSDNHSDSSYPSDFEDAVSSSSGSVDEEALRVTTLPK